MKKIFLGLMIWCLSFAGARVVYGQEQVELGVSKEKVAVGEVFEVGVTISKAGSGSMNVSGVEIPGMENFGVQGTSTSTRVQIVNGQSAAVTTTTYSLVGVEEGVYALGPVIVGDDSSDEVQLEVSGKSGGVMTPGVGGSQSQFGGGQNTKMPVVSKPVETGWGGIGVLAGLGLVIVVGVLVIGWILGKGKKNDEKDPSTSQNTINSGNSGDEAHDLGSLQGVSSVPSGEIEYSVDEIRQMTVEWLEKQSGKTLKHMSTAEIRKEVSGSDDGKIEAAINVLNACDKATYAKETVSSKTLTAEFRKIVN